MPISALTMSHRGVNQFKEEWLKKTDSNGDVINSYLAKLGDFHVKCNWCKTDISVDNLGFTAAKGHSETKGHVQIADLRMKRLTDRAVVSNRQN